MSREIVIGYGNPELGRDALALGGLLAKTLAARPVITSVQVLPDRLLGRQDLASALERHAGEQMAEAMEELKDLDPKTSTIVGDSPAHALHRLAEEDEPLLVVVGSGHRNPLGRIFLGSVGEALLSGAPCPIAVAPRGYAERRDGLSSVAVAVNGSPESWSAFAAATSLSARSGADLTVIAVAPPPHYDYGAILAILSDDDYRTGERKAMEDVLDSAFERAPEGIKIRRRLAQGEASEHIAELAEDVDLLIVGSRSYGPVRRALLGGVSAKLVRRARCPVLVLPRSAGEDPLRLAEDSGPSA